MKRKTQNRKKPSKPVNVSAKASGGNVIINVPIPKRAPGKQSVRRTVPKVNVVTPQLPLSSSLYNGLLGDRSLVKLNEHSKALGEIKATQQKIQNQLVEDGLRRSSEIVAINNLIHNKGNVTQSPSGQLTPSTTLTKSLEEMRAFLKANREYIPSTKANYYTDQKIDELQANRIQDLYAEVRRHIERLYNDPEDGYVTPTFDTNATQEEAKVWLQNRLSTGKKLGKEERAWLDSLGLLDTVPSEAFKED